MEHLISEESDFAKRIAYLPFSVRRLLLLNDAMAWKKNPHKIITMSHHHIAKGNRIYKMNKADLFLYVKWPHRQSPVLGLFFACLLYRLSFVKLLESFECNRSVVLISNGATLRRCGRCSRRDRNLPALTRLQTFSNALASIFTFTS